MVDAGHPQRRIALHARASDHRVLDRRRQRVAGVQRAGDVRRRLRDHERLLRPVGATALAFRREDVSLEPALIDARLDIRRVVGGRHRLPLGSAVSLVFGALARRCRSPPCLLRKTKRPRSSSGRRGRGTTCWFGAGRTAVIPRPVAPDRSLRALSGAPATTRGRRSRRRAWSDFSLAAGLLCSGRSGATPSGRCRRAPSAMHRPPCVSTLTADPRLPRLPAPRWTAS